MKKIIVVYCFLFFSYFLNSSLHGSDTPMSVDCGAFSHKGGRAQQEDTCRFDEITVNGKRYHVAMVCDGHSGDKVAKLAIDQFIPLFRQALSATTNPCVLDCLKKTSQRIEELTKGQEYQGSGSTLSVACFDYQTRQLPALWVGDSQMFFKNGNFFELTSAHNCSNPEEIARVGEEKIKNGKINGKIDLTRSLGDAFAKARPDFSCLQFEPEFKKWQVNTLEQEFCGFTILASDGFWITIKDAQDLFECYLDASELSHQDFYKKYPLPSNSKNDADVVSPYDSEEEEDVPTTESVALRLIRIALSRSNRNSADNMTLVMQEFYAEKNEKDSVLNIAQQQAEDSSFLDAIQTGLSQLLSGDFARPNPYDNSVEPIPTAESSLIIDSNNSGVCHHTSLVPGDENEGPLRKLVSSRTITKKYGGKKVSKAEQDDKQEKDTENLGLSRYKQFVDNADEKYKKEQQKKKIGHQNQFICFLRNNGMVLAGGCLTLAAVFYMMYKMWPIATVQNS